MRVGGRELTMKKVRFLWKSTCSTCRDARQFLRDELHLELDERNYAKEPLTLAELKEVFKNADAREFINPKSPAFKARGLRGRPLTPAQALKLMAEEPNLIKRPLVIVDGAIIAGFDRARLRADLAGR
ncbi:MAG: arsenate reductase family protein [Candidatus Binataceae bacterium]